jgi:hypothetical protein
MDRDRGYSTEVNYHLAMMTNWILATLDQIVDGAMYCAEYIGIICYNEQMLNLRIFYDKL